MPAADSTALPAAASEPSGFRAAGVLTVSSAHFVHDTFTAFFAPLLPVLIENFGMTKTAAGLLSVFYQGPSLFQPLLGRLGDRFNLRLLVVLGPAVSAAMLTLLGVAPGYGALAVLLLVAGFSSAGLHAIGPVTAGLLSGRKLGLGMSFWMVGGELGRTLGPVILVTAVAALSPRGLPWLMIGGAVASLALFFRLPEAPNFRSVDHNGIPLSQALAGMRPALLPLSGVILARSMLFSAVVTFLPTLLSDEGAPLWLAGASLSVMQAAGVVGALSGGVISDRLGRRRVMVLMSLAAPLAVLLFLLARGWMVFPVLLLVGFTLLSTTPVMMALVQERAPQSRALANGVFMAVNFIGQSLGVVAVGWIGDQIGLRAAFQSSTWIMLAGLPFAYFLPKD